MSILSASEIKLLERMLEEREIRPYFDHVVGLSDRYAASKLDHGKQLITTLNTPLQNVILVGDTNHDHEVAQSLGIDCLLLAGGHQSEHRLADYETINQLTDLLNHPAVL